MSEIIKVYDTEANAIANGTTGRIDPVVAISGQSGIISNSEAALPYYIYNKYYYRIESNEPVAEFHIDWDDGEDNSPEKANIEIIKLGTPKFYAITSHIYTEHKHFFPLVRVKSMDGFLSKWYTSNSSLNDYSALWRDVDDTDLPSGQNNFSEVSEEKATYASATITITDFTELNSGDKVNLVATDGTNYDFTIGDQSSVNGTWESTTSNDATATNLMNVINTSSGSAGTRFTATVSGAVVTATQATAGSAGNTTVTLTDSGTAGMSKTNFSGSTILINSFLPSNLPPIGVLKADKKRMYSGIDNDTILSSYAYPLLYTYSTSTASTKPNVVFTIQDDNGATRKHTLDNSSTNYILSTTGSWTNEGSTSKLAVNCIPLGNYKATDSAPEEHTITLHGSANVGTTPTVNDDVAWTSNTGSGNKYIDVHYEAAEIADANGNYHCRFFWWGSSSGEGYPTGASLPDGYSAVKVPLPVEDNENDLMVNLRTAMEDFLGQTGGGCLIVGPSVLADTPAQFDRSFNYVVDGEGPCTNPSASNISGTYILFTVVQDSTTAITTTTSVKKLLRVELANAKLFSDTDRVYVKVFDAGIGLSGLPSSTGDATTAILSNGNPIVDLSDPLTVLHLDGTESRTRASNINISTYNFDDDKLNAGGVVQVTDVDGVSDLINGTFSTVGSKALSYSFSNIGDSVDPDGRFYSTYRLPRLQVKDSMTDSTTTNASDALTYSAIEHFADTSYTGTTIFQPSDLESKALLLYSNKDTAPADGVGLWADVSSRNIIDTSEIFGGSSTYQLRDSTNLTDHPRNHLFIAKTDKFDRIFFRMNNTNAVAEANWPPSIAISVYYGNGTTWTPLEIIDETQGLQTSGSIKFTMPSDWYKGQYTHIDGGDWIGPVDHQGDTGAVAPGDLWTFNAYGLLICFTVKGTSANETKLKCMNVWPYNNSHSQLIEVIDSHSVSLNSIAIAQSISFGRSSKTITIEDKFGKSDIRKMGAAGGSVTFGGVDFGGTDDHRKTMVGYQKNATPVFLDVTHKSGEITRFFGVITNLTEDHPAGKMFPKWAVTMQISYILELGSDGLINSDKIPIGGALVDDGKYLL